MVYLVPQYPIKNNCIGCGCKVSPTTKNNIKKAFAIGFEKAATIWSTQQVVTNYKHHKMCRNCFEADVPIPSKSVDQVDLEILVKALTLAFAAKKDPPISSISETTTSKLECAKLSQEQCEEACGLNHDQLKDLSQLINHSVQIVFEFFCICRQGISQHFTAVLVDKNQSTISRNFFSVLESLTNSFVPKWLGSSAFSREDIKINYTPTLFKNIHPDVCGTIDETYFYGEKSSVFEAQRKTYNKPKGRNLMKEMGIVLPNGRFYDFTGPFYSDGDHNDEWMWLYIVDNNLCGIKSVFQPETDKFLADRGFSHCTEEENGFSLI